ncbi:trimethylamine methyltransferase family protein [Ostreibacterium oceani]|uniref:Methyltransferase n=1 Tax=Ostreibacterium oceani TaxID=2654998 RepID=A0A6N7EUI1_9GAMM|nr:trimethylamine methyltransferase family protein [Ostreibacterium oceani]MPV85275.1 trimethylamine methyltransferase [Ostreibacterium oceani]
MSERRSRRGRGGADARIEKTIKPFAERKIPYFDIISEADYQIIEDNAETILNEIGIEFRGDEEAIQMWRDAGCTIEGERVRFPRGLCRQLIQDNAPREYTQHARNPARTTIIGGDRMVNVPAYGSPFVSSLDFERRYATLDDFQNFVKLAYMCDSLHHSGGTVCEPVDIPVNKRHLDMVYAHMKYSDKPFMASVTAPERSQDTVDMLKILFGDDFYDENGEPKTFTSSLINANSPMTFDDTMLGALKVLARNNQATVVSPFILAGAMSPVAVAGTCSQILAESMAGMAFAQLIRPGAPVVFGTFSSSISMQSGAPTFGTPEPAQILYITAGLARRLGVPFRSGGGFCASKVVDAQAAVEAANTMSHSSMAGINFMLHTAGWLEGGLVMNYEKFVIDADQIGMAQRIIGGVDMTENGQAMDAIREVGPGKHYLGCAHTQRNFKDAFYLSPLTDNNSYEQWSAEGKLTMEQRANAYWKKLLAAYEAPPLDAETDAALQAFIEKRKNEMPDEIG